MLLTVLLTLAAALTAAASTKAARSALDAYFDKHPATIELLVRNLRWRVRTVQDAEDLASQAMEVAFRRERTGKGRRWVEGGTYPPMVHLIYIARMLLKVARKKGQSFQTLSLDEPDILESEDRNFEEMALELDEQDERAVFVRTLREICKGETNGGLTLGILDNAAVRSREELARILGCEPKDVKAAYMRLMRRADALRQQQEGAAS
jgi:DNA-directed RNA polymerase specialized sigma24 family protein